MTLLKICDFCKKEISEGEDYFVGSLVTPSNPYVENKDSHICCLCLPNLEFLLKKKTKTFNKNKNN